MSTDKKGLSVTEWLVLIVAAIGFLFDTYELLMFPLIGGPAISELLGVPLTSKAIPNWSGRMLWISALCGGVFGLLGGWLIDRFGRKTIMAVSIFLYSFSPVAAAFSTSLPMLIIFRCTTFIGVCVEAVAAVTWLSELFEDPRRKKLVIGWTLAFASLGGVLVTEAFRQIVHFAPQLHPLPLPEPFKGNASWRFTLLTGLVPGALILLLLPFVPESRIWKAKKLAGTLLRPRFRELFAPDLRRTTISATLLCACGYAAAFGALQLTPLQLAPGLPEIAASRTEVLKQVKEINTQLDGLDKKSTDFKTLADKKSHLQKDLDVQTLSKRADIQRWQELGGLLGRIVLAILLLVISSHRSLLRIFLVPGVFVVPITYVYLYQGDYTIFAAAMFICGALIVGQFSYFSEYLPKAYPLHLRGTGGGFATNVGGRMLGTMAALLNTELIAPMFHSSDNFTRVALAAAVIGGGAFVVGLVVSFFLPEPRKETAD